MVAGGSGHRFGDRKQFLPLAGRPVAAWAVAAARSVSDGVVVVVPAAGPDSRPGTVVGGEGEPLGADRAVVGDDTRAGSVRAGLAHVPDGAAVIVVHDAARPLAGAPLFRAVIEAVQTGGAGGAIPVLPVVDTLKRISGDTVRSTVDRDGLVAVQTPQAFVAGVLRSAHQGAGEAGDDAALVERSGASVRTVPGDPRNLKITRPQDLEMAEALVGGSVGRSGAGAGPEGPGRAAEVPVGRLRR